METRQEQFDRWLDGILSQLDMDIRAYCFNIYECPPSNCYSVELTGFCEYDKYDVDWACGGTENYASRDDNNEFGITGAGDWEKCLDVVDDLITSYLKRGKYADKLNKAQRVCYGFIDGDLYTVK